MPKKINVLNQRSTKATVQQMRKLISTHQQTPPETRRKVFRGSRTSTIPIRFLLKSSLSNGTATADVWTLDGAELGTNVEILDPERVFSLLDNGDRGYGTRWRGKFYVNHNAKCPG